MYKVINHKIEHIFSDRSPTLFTSSKYLESFFISGLEVTGRSNSKSFQENEEGRIDSEIILLSSKYFKLINQPLSLVTYPVSYQKYDRQK
ncbi:MAG: hypothetical protein WBA93_24475 [Microcoleaceae cyanobacterium]